MKIISKYKDFYDFLVGKYGQDEKIIFDRRKNFPLKTQFDVNFQYFKERLIKGEVDYLIHSILLIGDQGIHIFKSQNKIYSHFDIKNFEILEGGWLYDKIVKYEFSDGDKFIILINFNYPYFDLGKFQDFNRKDFLQNIKNRHINTENFNEQEVGELFVVMENIGEIPVILIQRQALNDLKIFINPSLQSLGIFLDPEWTWQNIYNFLLRLKTEKENYHEAKNDEKIVNKGFDLKTSFRPKMKK